MKLKFNGRLDLKSPKLSKNDLVPIVNNITYDKALLVFIELMADVWFHGSVYDVIWGPGNFGSFRMLIAIRTINFEFSLVEGTSSSLNSFCWQVKCNS